MRYLDTTYLVDLLRGIAPATRKAAALQETNEALATPAPCIAEIVRGIRTSGKRERAAAEDLLAQLEIAPLDEEAARRAGVIAAETSDRGHEVNMIDCLVAGIVIARDGVLVTRDSDFARIPGLTLETY